MAWLVGGKALGGVWTASWLTCVDRAWFGGGNGWLTDVVCRHGQGSRY